MKNYTLYLFLLCNFFTTIILAQEYTNFYTVKADLDPYYDSLIQVNGIDNMRGTGYTQYMRWTDYWEPLLYPHGDFSIEYQKQNQYVSDFISGNTDQSVTPFTLEYELIGPDKMPDGQTNWDKGLGQIHYIAFDPNDPSNQKMFACSPAGGLWRSLNGGETWFNAGTDKELPICGVSSVAIDPQNSDTHWFITTGNAEGLNRNVWQYAIGVWRTTDAGTTWQQIGLEQVSNMRKVILQRHQGNIHLFVATTWGLYECENALVSNPEFNKLIDGNFYDVEFDPQNTGIVYASGTGPNTSVYKIDWINDVYTELPNLSSIPVEDGRRLTIEISEAAPDYLFIVATYKGEDKDAFLYKYTLSTNTIVTKGKLSRQGNNEQGIGHERAMGWIISPVLNNNNDLTMVYGNTAPIRQSNNLLDDNNCVWTNVTSTYHYCEIHVDMHYMLFEPDGQTLWVGSDGGVFKSTMPDIINNWEEKCNGLAVATVYHMAVSEGNKDIAIGGAFDCGSNLYTRSNDEWNEKHVISGDGYQCQINWDNPDMIWGSLQKRVYRSDNGGQSFSPKYGNLHWHSFYIQNHIFPEILYGTNANGIRRSTNYGDSWHNYAEYPGVSNNNTWRVSASVTHGNYLYATWYGNTSGNSQKVFKTTSGGGTNPDNWEDVGSPLVNKWINSIVVDYFNPDRIWVAAGGKVYDVNTITHQWTDVSSGLPSYVHVRHLEILPGTDATLFAATNYGLYYYTEQEGAWQYVEGDLPNVDIRDIQIDMENNRIAVATFGRGIWEADLPCITDETNLTIHTNETWTTNKSFSGTLTIEPSAELSIQNVTISFSENGKIVIKPGAKLIIDGGTLTNACSEMWQGIQVWGNSTAHQSPDANGNYQHGYLKLINGATIENAIIAVDLWKPNDYSTTGGMVYATGATFRNNTQSVHALHYRNFNPNLSTEEWNYFSNFKNCTFEITEDYLGDVTFYKHVDLAHVKGIDFQGCDFSLDENAANVSTWNHAIAGYDAKFRVSAICNSPVSPCPEEDYDKCTFTGFFSAISAVNDGSIPLTFSVSRAEFIDNVYGVKTREMNNATVLFSDFEIGHLWECGAGIYADNVTGFAFEENEFSKYSGGPVSDYFGIIINNSCAVNEVYKNKFNGLSYANFSDGINWGDNRYEGLAYYCNENANNYADFFVADDSLPHHRSGIQSEQGSNNYVAGNTFTQSGATWHFYNGGEHLVGYYYNQNENDENPDNDKTHQVFEAGRSVTNNCPSHYGLPERGILLTQQQKSDAEQEYYSNLIDYNSVKVIYDNLVDGGDTEGEKLDIKTAQPSDMWDLRAQLLGDSPHLSFDVLKEAADKTDVFTEAVIFDIMAANPDELKKDTLISYLENKEEPLPVYMTDILQQLAEGITYKTALQQQMAGYKHSYSRAAHDIIRSNLNDTVTNNNELRDWLDNLGGITSDRQIISSYISEGNFTDALALANMLPQLYKLEGNELTEHNYYMDMLNLHQTLFQQGRNTFQLNSTEKAGIDFIANNSKGVAGAQAKSILEAVYNEYYDDCPDADGTAGYKSSSVINPDALGKAYGLSISVKPNPARQWAAFDYTLPGDETEATITVTNVTGSIVEILKVNGQQGQKLWDTRDIEPGVYIYTLKAAGFSQSGKIIVSK